MAEMSGQGNDVEQQLLSSNPIIEVGAPTIHAGPSAPLHLLPFCAQRPAH